MLPQWYENFVYNRNGVLKYFWLNDTAVGLDPLFAVGTICFYHLIFWKKYNQYSFLVLMFGQVFMREKESETPLRKTAHWMQQNICALIQVLSWYICTYKNQ